MKRVLIVDDNADQVALLALVLRKQYQVDTCTNLRDFDVAVGKNIPDVVLLDLHIGAHDARDFKEALALRELTSVPIVLMTGDVRGAEKAERLGCAGVLNKPFALTAMMELVGQVVAPV